MSKRTRAVERLNKRKEWLNKRIKEGENEGKDLSYDKAELSSINYAIEELQKGYEDV